MSDSSYTSDVLQPNRVQWKQDCMSAFPAPSSMSFSPKTSYLSRKTIREHLEGGLQALHIGQLETAQQTLEQAKKDVHFLAPNEKLLCCDKAKLFELSGSISLHIGRAAEAACSFRCMIAFEEKAGFSHSQLSRSYTKLAKALRQAQDFDQAEQHYRKALNLAQTGQATPEDHMRLHFQMAELLEENERFNEAIAQWKHAIRWAEQGQAAPTRLGLLWYRQANAIKPLALIFHTLGSLTPLEEEFLELDDCDCYIDSSEASSEQIPTEEKSLLDAQQAYQTALEYFDSSLETSASPQSYGEVLFNIWRGLAEIYTLRCQLPDSIDAYNQAQEAFTHTGLSTIELATILHDQAGIYSRLGQSHQGIKAYQKAIGLKRSCHTCPKSIADSLEELSYLFEKIEDYEEAAESLREAIELKECYSSYEDLAFMYNDLASYYAKAHQDHESEQARSKAKHYENMCPLYQYELYPGDFGQSFPSFLDEAYDN